jgi:hypothetical protein
VIFALADLWISQLPCSLSHAAAERIHCGSSTCDAEVINNGVKTYVFMPSAAIYSDPAHHLKMALEEWNALRGHLAQAAQQLAPLSAAMWWPQLRHEWLQGQAKCYTTASCAATEQMQGQTPHMTLAVVRVLSGPMSDPYRVHAQLDVLEFCDTVHVLPHREVQSFSAPHQSTAMWLGWRERPCMCDT